MIFRRVLPELEEDLRSSPATAILGPRQVGKTTLARQIVERHSAPSLYLDLENPADRAVLENPTDFLASKSGHLIVLDEVQRLPRLFEALRVVIDSRLRAGETAGQFLLLGSASRDLLQQSSESLAGRIVYRELTPFLPDETDEIAPDSLWVRGGFPNSVLATTESRSLRWRENFLRTYLERDLPQLGIRTPVETLRRFWTMLAHCQGGLLNASQLAASLAITGKTVAHYLDLAVDLLLVRRLEPWHANVGKRLVRSPKTYVRDSGLLHALLGIANLDELLAHPIAGPSWEGFVIAALIAAAGDRRRPWFYRTVAGGEIDLLIEKSGQLWAVEINRSSAPKAGRGFHLACEDLGVTRRLLVYPGAHQYRAAGDIEVMNVTTAMAELRATTS